MMALQRDSSVTHERVPPQSVELEMCVLGGIMLEPEEAYSVAADHLRPEDFYLDGHGIIFKLMGDLVHRGIPPDANAVVDELRARQLIDKVGGSGVVMGMINSVPTAANVEYHAKKVAEKAEARELIRSCTKAIEHAYLQSDPLAQVIDQLEGKLAMLSDRSGGSEFTRVSAVLEQYMEKLERRDTELKQRREAGEVNPTIAAGLPTGYSDLDNLTGGLRRSELSIIAARPSVGKTALGLNIAEYVAIKEQVPVALFSLEMGAEQLCERLLAMGTMHTDPRTGVMRGVSTLTFRNPNLDDWQWGLLTKSYQRLASAPVYLDDSSFQTIRTLRSRARVLYRKFGVRLFIVDYLQLLTGTGTNDGRVQEVSEISRGLKLIARELKVPIIALSQLSREVEKRQTKRPQLSDLRESGSIEQDADIVMFIHHPEEDRPGEQTRIINLMVAKNRNGPTGVVHLVWHKSLTRFLPRARTDADPALPPKTMQRGAQT